MPRLLTVDQAATELGVAQKGLRRAAERHGLLGPVHTIAQHRR